MQKPLVITATGDDRVGIVDDVTKIILAHHGNVDASRMARLGGVFAMLMLVSVAEDHLNELQTALDGLRNQGFDLTIRATQRGISQKFRGWHRFQINVRGADHEGIIHEITHHLAQQGVSVETIDTGTEDAPFGGTKLFVMDATVFAPPNSSIESLQEELDAVGNELNVDIEVEPLDS
ncbi:glycine cleavage system protein R [Candidatus Leptofilum sp.]|uniref:glycine cleavage system protein R n=1 Tax=Candidatus Leptofilum sp. TaxID=3241576 RepID=UPI003B59FECC